MKSILTQVIIGCLLVTMAGTAAFAKSRKTNIALAVDTKVNGTLVKKGMYEVVFDEESGELSIVKRGKLVVKTTARAEKRDHKARSAEVYTTLDGMEQKLVSIAFNGSYENLVVAEAGMQAGGN